MTDAARREVLWAERRLKCVSVPERTVAQAMLSDEALVFPELPADAVLMRVVLDMLDFSFIFAHESFEPVPAGSHPPFIPQAL